MKNLWVLLLLVLPMHVLAQDEIKPFYGQELSFGINSPGIDIRLESDEKVQQVRGEELFWNIAYKIKLTPEQTMRMGINFNILPAASQKYWVRGLNAGYQYQFNSPSMRWQWFIGGDVVFLYDVTYTGETIDTLNPVALVEREWEIGLGPVAGVQFRISPRFSVTSEVGCYGAFRNSRISTDEIPPLEQSSSNDFTFNFHRLFSVGFGYHFGAFTPAPARDEAPDEPDNE
ncbi:MAG: hypothetical protein WD077_14835 [Bacteroidia bacterium]